jgi:hypothetical protein
MADADNPNILVIWGDDIITGQGVFRTGLEKMEAAITAHR